MIRVALRGMARRKLRTALTAIAIVLGVALITGTYVLTDSIKGAFGGIFTSVYRGTDATVTGKSAFDLSGSGTTTAPPFDESLLPVIRNLPDVSDAVGGVGGNAHLVLDGKVVHFGGAPNLGFSVDPTRPELNTLTLVDGKWNFKITKPDGAICTDGSYAPAYISLALDPATLAGTITTDSNYDCPGGTITQAPFQLHQVS